MGRRLWSWINVRWPVSPLLRVLFTEDIPGGPSAFYSLGSSVLFVFILQAVTGICQLFFYVPTVDHAYASLSFFRTEVPRNGSAGAWAESDFGASGGRRAGVPQDDHFNRRL